MSSLTREQLTILLNDPSELGNKALGFGDYKEVIAELVRDALALRALPAGDGVVVPREKFMAGNTALADARQWAEEQFEFLGAEHSSPAPVAAEDYKALHTELIMQVSMKHPGETRHQTALRYLQNAEKSSDQCSAARANESPVDSQTSKEGN